MIQAIFFPTGQHRTNPQINYHQDHYDWDPSMWNHKWWYHRKKMLINELNTSAGRSLMNSKKRVGPKTDPWGTPALNSSYPRKKAFGMRRSLSHRKIQKMWMEFTSFWKSCVDWEFTFLRNKRMKLLWAVSLKVTVEKWQTSNISTMGERLEWRKKLISH